MQLKQPNKHSPSGFSLVEMAIVLAIVGLLLGGLLPSLSGQVSQQRLNETRKQMDEIRSALLGFSVAKGRLPCPDTDTPADGYENISATTSINNDQPQTGQSTKVFTCANQSGAVPYNDLGTQQLDSYNAPYLYRVTLAFAEKNEIYSGLNAGGSLLEKYYFLLSSSGTLRVCNTQACTSPRLIDNAAAVVVSRGADWGSTPSTDEAENTDSDNDFVSHDPSPSFDDLVVWLSPNIIFNRMVAAGKLP
jgi:prepilin-type N-terminal cleavage/methylation domain-containing protein